MRKNIFVICFIVVLFCVSFAFALDDPLPLVPSSPSYVEAVPNPTPVGADAILNGTEFLILYNTGIADVHLDGSSTKYNSIDFGISNPTGISEVPESYGMGGTIAVSGSTRIYFFDLIGTPKGDIFVDTPYDVTDISWDAERQRMLVATTDSIGELNGDGSLSELLDASVQGIEVIDMDSEYYDMIQAGNTFYKINIDGSIIVSGKATNYGHGGAVIGQGFTQNYGVSSIPEGIIIDQKADFQDHMSFEVGLPNSQPTLDPIENKEVNESETLTIQLSATDPENNDLNYSIGAQLPSAYTFNNLTGLFEWTPTYDDSGNYTVTFIVTDSQLEDNKTINITVYNVNRAPIIDSIGNKQANMGEELSFIVTASDPDNDSLTYDAVNLPDGATFTDQLFSWIPSNPGEFNVTFNVSDGILYGNETITITVEVSGIPGDADLDSDVDLDDFVILKTNFGSDDADWEQGDFDNSDNVDLDDFVILKNNFGIFSAVNNPPILNPIGNKIIDSSETLIIQLDAADPDDDTLTYSIIGNLPSSYVFNESTGYFEWAPTSNDTGNHSVTFEVSDGEMWDEKTITITVKAVVIPGDADLDGDVDLDDFVILKTNFGSNGVGWGQGDLDGDSDVDLDDFVILKNNFGMKGRKK